MGWPLPPKWIPTGRPTSQAAAKIGRNCRLPYGALDRTKSSTCTKRGSAAARLISAAAADRVVGIDHNRAAPARIVVEPSVRGPLVDRAHQRVGKVEVVQGRHAVERIEHGHVNAPSIEQLGAGKIRDRRPALSPKAAKHRAAQLAQTPWDRLARADR